MKKLLCTAFAALLGATPAFAQNAVDVGVIKNEDVKIVQKLLCRRPIASSTALTSV